LQISSHYSKSGQKLPSSRGRRTFSSLSRPFPPFFAAHIAETAIWAVFFWKSGQLGSFADGWYFAGVSHTTLGYGDVVLQKPWRSLGPICAINGLLTFGCSTAFFFLLLQSIWQRPL
jgi:Ion channel